jgi:nitroimidazol reductase NimA-like FMN-containing flavoprotein (pyridoxamine 5'-phosphate oxidase superfamily)
MDIRDTPTDHTGLRVMGLDECLERLADAAVGRFAFPLDGEISVLPVVHTVDGVDVCFRTRGDSKIEAAVDKERVAYEVDDWDATTRTGWSVLVQGTAVIVDDAADVKRLELAARRPWVELSDSYRWIRVRTQSITGRALE